MQADSRHASKGAIHSRRRTVKLNRGDRLQEPDTARKPMWRPPSAPAFGPVATAYSFGLSFQGVESQTFTVLSKLAEARRLPSGLNATRLTTLL